MTKKTKIKAIVLVASFALLLLVGFYFLSAFIHTLGQVAATANNTGYIISEYIKQNNGCFPKSEEDLVRQGFVKKIKASDSNKYFLKLGPPELGERAYYQRPWFNAFKIAYGVDIRNLKAIGSKIYNLSNQKQVLLIDGPYQKQLKEQYYEHISLEWYKLMLKEKEKQSTENKQQ